jgi:hypothetical protein
MKIFSIIILFILTMTACKKDRDWKARITGLKDLNTIKVECSNFQSELNSKEEIIKIGHDTTIAPFFYNIILYPPMANQDLHDFENRYNFDVPDSYESVLTQINGAFFYDISLYGFPRSFVKNGVNRKELEPLNLYTANDSWIKEMGQDEEDFLFGASHYNDSVNINYFIKEQIIVGYLDTGEKMRTWNSIDEMLGDEIKRLRGK